MLKNYSKTEMYPNFVFYESLLNKNRYFNEIFHTRYQCHSWRLFLFTIIVIHCDYILNSGLKQCTSYGQNMSSMIPKY